jgi:dTDP-glucose 4,6-dehydratase
VNEPGWSAFVKQVLVTGGAGFIGSNFVRFLLRRDPEIQVFNLDALTYAGSMENLRFLPDEERHTFIKGDITDRDLVDQLFREHAIDTVVHFAAETHVDRSIIAPTPFIETNIIGTFTLLEAARKFWVEGKNFPLDQVRFHHISTDEVYGALEPGEPAFVETSIYHPHSPYSASKASSDHLVRAYAHTYNLPITITNCSNNYGPFQFPEKLIPLTILSANAGKPVPIYGDGSQIRDWLFVEDHCEAIWIVLRKGQLGETYNIGGNHQIANLDLVTIICHVLDEALPDSPYLPHESLITCIEDRPGHDFRYAMDTNKIMGELGWKPKETLESGIRKTVDWYLSEKEWVRAIQVQPDYQAWLAENYSTRWEVS